MVEVDIVRAFVVYRRAGWSLPRLAAALWERYGYASRASCQVALQKAFARAGFELRDRAAATRAAVSTHGRCAGDYNRNEYYRWLREQRKVAQRCVGSKTRGGGRCRLTAMRGSVYCRAHDPDRRQDVLDHMSSARQVRLARRVEKRAS